MQFFIDSFNTDIDNPYKYNLHSYILLGVYDNFGHKRPDRQGILSTIRFLQVCLHADT